MIDITEKYTSSSQYPYIDYPTAWEGKEGLVYSDLADQDILNGGPTALAVTGVDFNSVEVVVTIGSFNHEGHIIESSLDGVTFNQVGVILGEEDTIVIGGLIPNLEYYFRARAYRGIQYSEYVNYYYYPLSGAPLDVDVSILPIDWESVRLSWDLGSLVFSNPEGYLVFSSEDNILFTQVGDVVGGGVDTTVIHESYRDWETTTSKGAPLKG